MEVRPPTCVSYLDRMPPRRSSALVRLSRLLQRPMLRTPPPPAVPPPPLIPVPPPPVPSLPDAPRTPGTDRAGASAARYSSNPTAPSVRRACPCDRHIRQAATQVYILET